MSHVHVSEHGKLRSFAELIDHYSGRRGHGQGGAVSGSDVSDSSIDDMTTAEYIRILRQVLDTLEPKSKEVGTEIYTHVATKNVELASMFKDTRFEDQTDAFMRMVIRSVQQMDDMHRWRKMMEPLAQRHVAYGVKPRHYKHFRTAFLKAVRKFVNPWTDEMEDAWRWYWDCIMETLGYATQSTLLETAGGLAPEQTAMFSKCLVDSWREVAENPQQFGSDFYANLLKNDETTAKLFSTTEMDKQGVRFFNMLNHAVKHVDDYVGFEHEMLVLVKQHRNYGVKLHHVEGFSRTFLQTLAQTLGDKWQGDWEDAWAWFWRRVTQCFEHGLAHTNDNSEIVKNESEVQTSTENSSTNNSPDRDNLPNDLANARIFQKTLSLRTSNARQE